MSTRPIGAMTLALGFAVAITALIGPLGLEWIDFRLGDSAVDQFVGGEVVSLAIVAPLLIIAGVLWSRGHPLAPVLAIGPALYAAYTYTTAVLGQEHTQYDGNVEHFFPLLTGLVLGGVVVAVCSWLEMGRISTVGEPYPVQHMLAWVFIALGVFFALTWAAQIRLVYIGDLPDDYAEGPALFWLIKFLDFAFCIPALIATGIGIRRGNETARKASFALAGFASCLIAAVFAMALALQISDDPSASIVLLIATGIGTCCLAGLTVKLMLTWWRAESGARA